MSVSRFFRSPLVRVPFLLFAVVATVATSVPAWQLDDTPIDQAITLAAGASVERKIGYEASHPVDLRTDLRTDLSSPDASGTKLRIVYDDATTPPASDAGGSRDRDNYRNACDSGWLYESNKAGKWKTTGDGTDPSDYWSSLASANATCSNNTGTVTIRITNEGRSSLDLHWTTIARIGDRGDEPKGAFVRAKVVP